jgi:hypothetical protein
MAVFIRALLLLLIVNVSQAEPIRLMRADQGKQVSYDDRVYRELEGNVWVRHKDMDFYFEHGKQNLQMGILHCWDDVKILRAGRELTADQVTFYQDEEQVRTHGNVHAVGDSMEVWCVEGNWWDGLSFGQLEEDVHILDKRRQLELFAGYVELEKDKGNYSASINPVIHRLGDDPLKLDARYIRWISDSTTAIAYGDVKLETAEFIAFCDSLVWQDSLGVAQFFGSPRFIRDDRQITGDTITAFTLDEQLDSLSVLGSARMASPSDSVSQLLMDVIEGDWIAMDFIAGELSFLKVRGQARSIVFMNDDKGLPGMNVADAQKMDFIINENELKSVDMIGKVKAMWIPLQKPPENTTILKQNAGNEEYPGGEN